MVLNVWTDAMSQRPLVCLFGAPGWSETLTVCSWLKMSEIGGSREVVMSGKGRMSSDWIFFDVEEQRQDVSQDGQRLS